MKTRHYDLIVAIIFILVVIFAIFVFWYKADAEQITLTWDSPQQVHDGVRIYQKTAKDDEVYNYDSPIADVPVPTTQVLIEVPGEQNAVLKYQWVARAYRDDIESIDSNEISYKVVNIPPLTPIQLSAQYADDIIHLVWQQPPDDYLISHWLIYYKRGDGDFLPLGRVNQGNELELTTGLTSIAPAGETSNLKFVVVAYRHSGVYSANSSEADLTINRESVEPIQNLRIEIEIPL